MDPTRQPLEKSDPDRPAAVRPSLTRPGPARGTAPPTPSTAAPRPRLVRRTPPPPASISKDPAVAPASGPASLRPEQLAAEIRAKHGEVRGRVLLDYRELGEMLLKAKATVGHGNFLGWVKEECGISAQCARDYMKISQGWSILESAAGSGTSEPDAKRALHFSIREAKRLIDASRLERPEAPTAPMPSVSTGPAAQAKKLRRSLARSFGPPEALPPVSSIGLKDSTRKDLQRLTPLQLAALVYELSGRDLESKVATACLGGKPS